MVRDAMTDERKIAAWQAALKKGDNDLDSGAGVPYTAGTLDEITQSAKAAMNSGQPVSPDVVGLQGLEWLRTELQKGLGSGPATPLDMAEVRAEGQRLRTQRLADAGPPPTSAQCRELEQRLATFDQDRSKASSWDDLKAELAARNITRRK